MIDGPEVSDETAAEFAMSKANLGWIGWLRSKLALVFILIAYALLPSEATEAISNQRMVSTGDAPDRDDETDATGSEE